VVAILNGGGGGNTDSNGSPSRRALLLILLLIVLAGAMLRLATLGERSFWLDEMTSIQASSESLATIAAGEAFDNHTPPLYYLLLHLWWWIAPATEFWLRLPSLLVDLLNIVLVWWVVERLFSRRVGLVAGAVYALSEYAVYYGQEGRMYSLACFFGLACFALALLYREDRDTVWSWLLLVLVAVSGAYTHYFNILLLAALSIALTIDRWSEPKRLLKWYGAMAVAGLAFLPWLSIVLELAAEGGQPFRRFVWLVLPYTLFRWAAGYAVFPLNYGSKDDVLASVAEQLPLVVLYLGVFGGLLVVGLRRLVVEHRRQAVLVLVPLCLPALLGLALSLFAPMLSERYLVVSFPFFAALLALAFTVPNRRLGLRLLQTAGVVLMLWALTQHYLSPSFGNTQWRQSIEHLRDTGLPARVIYVYPEWTREVVGVYAASSFEVRPLSAELLEDMLEPQRDPDHDPRPRQLWLLERGNVPTISHSLTGAGYEITHQELFELRNGVRVFYLERDPESSTPP
jgi:uncharacterized membrane protein